MFDVRFVGDLQRLTVKPGDVFVVTCEGLLTEEGAKRIRSICEERLGAKVLVLGEGMRLGVVSQEDGNSIESFEGEGAGIRAYVAKQTREALKRLDANL